MLFGENVIGEDPESRVSIGFRLFDVVLSIFSLAVVRDEDCNYEDKHDEHDDDDELDASSIAKKFSDTI